MKAKRSEIIKQLIEAALHPETRKKLLILRPGIEALAKSGFVKDRKKFAEILKLIDDENKEN